MQYSNILACIYAISNALHQWEMFMSSWKMSPHCYYLSQKLSGLNEWQAFDNQSNFKHV